VVWQLYLAGWLRKWSISVVMYYRLNNFTGRLIGSTHIQPYFPIVRAKFLYLVVRSRLVTSRPETGGMSQIKKIIVLLLCYILLNIIK
jgi:hypothetical protein